MGKKGDDDTKEVETSLEEEKPDDAIPSKRKRNNMEQERNSALDNETATGSKNEIATENTLNKGPWSQEEDKMLVAYVKQHGEGKWDTVQKHSGLSRCGRSCRFRWVNHLRPGLKKGAFTEEEEQIVFELHASYGSKWARMALKLPGRTDNEIKNFWNARVKRRQRQNLPVNPDGVREKVMNAASQSGQNNDLFGVNQRQEDYSAPFFKFFPPPKKDQSYYESFRSPSYTDDFMKQILSLLQPNTSNVSHSKQELVNSGYSMKVQIPPACNYPFVESNPEQFTSFNPPEVPNDWRVQQSNSVPPVLQSENSFVSAGVRQTTDSGSQLEPAKANTTDEVSIPPRPPSAGEE